MNNEEERIAKVLSYRILNTKPSDVFDQITATICKVFSVPIALISFADRHNHWFKSKQGLDFSQVSREHSFCSRAIENPEQVFVIEDTLLDDKYSKYGCVTSDLKIRFYAGLPLVDRDGFVLGTICIMDKKPRTVTTQEIEILKSFSQLVMSHIYNYSSLEIVDSQGNFEEIVLDNLRSFVFLKDNKNNILYANRTACESLGYSAYELVNQPTSRFYPEYSEKSYSDDKEVLSTGSPKFGIIESFINKEGKEVWISTDKIPIRDKSNQINSILVVARDITEQKRLEEELISKNALKSEILDNSSFTIFSTDKEGIIQTFSRGASELLGYRKEDVVGRVSPLIFHDMHEIQTEITKSEFLSSNLFDALLSRARASDVYAREWTYVTKDGKRIPVLLKIAAVTTEEQGLSGYVYIAKDLSPEKGESEIKIICDMLEKNVQELKNAIQVKSEFFAKMSHEIRTPLTSIISIATLLLQEPHHEGDTEDLTDILESANYLKKILGSILDYAKIESGNMGLIQDNYSSDFLIKELEKLVVNAHTNKKLSFEKEISKSLPEKVSIDFNKVMYIVENLISNAIKYSNEEVHLKLTVDQKEEDLIISISDKGVGISEANYKDIFKPYIQLDGSLSNDKNGLGLGLPLSKALASLMGGNLIFYSNIDRGTTFQLNIPITYREDYFISDNTCQAQVQGKKILFAEDNPTNRNSIKKMLEHIGFLVTDVDNGVEALFKATTSEYDLILLDIHMPQMNGLQVLERLSQNDICQKTPVLMISACVLDHEIKYSKDLGSRGFIAKPVDINDLELKIKAVMFS